MCRSIRTLRPPASEQVTTGDVHAAARQYVRKLTGFRTPSAANEAAFEQAIGAIAATTIDLLEALDVRGQDPVTIVDGPEADLRALARARREAEEAREAARSTA